MTRQESLKRRIRARMKLTGKRYTAARRELLSHANSHRRSWVSQPEMSNDAVLQGTGRGWEDWCDLIDAWDGRVDGHKAIAAWLKQEGHARAWWAQTITVGYERITGLRLPYQKADGSFSANKSKTLHTDANELATLLRSPAAHADLFPDQPTELRSRVQSRSVRIAFSDGVVLFGVEQKPDGKAKVTIEHNKLTSLDDVQRWRFYWGEWLDALE